MAVKIWTGATDGDWSVAGNWSPSGVPASTDDVIISAAYTVSITAGLNQSAVTLNSLTVEEGYSGAIGSKSADLQIATDALTFQGSGVAYIDLGSNAVDPVINGTASYSTGESGLYLTGTGIGTITCAGGGVSIGRAGTTSTVTELRGISGDVHVGIGGTVTNRFNFGASVVFDSTHTTLNLDAGTTTLKQSAAVTTANLDGGVLHIDSACTITTLNLNNGGEFRASAGSDKTITTLNIEPGAVFEYYPSNTTITNRNLPTDPARITTARI